MNSNTQSLRKRKCVKLLKKSYRKSDLPCRDKGNQEFPPQPQQQISKISSQRTEKTEKHIKGYRLTMHNKPNSSSLPQLITTSAHLVFHDINQHGLLDKLLPWMLIDRR